MDNLERLEKKKKDLQDWYSRELSMIEDEITKEKAHKKRQKEADKKKKEQQMQQNNLSGENAAYQDFVKNSTPITEINKILEKFLNS